MKVAALQMVSGLGLAANLAQARRLLEQAASAGAELAVLPEYFCAMGRRDEDKLQLAERLGDGPVQSFLAAAARELGLWIVGGTLPLASDEPARVYNSSLAYSPAGSCVAPGSWRRATPVCGSSRMWPKTSMKFGGRTNCFRHRAATCRCTTTLACCASAPCMPIASIWTNTTAL